jgi:hypothetical protein
MYTDIDDELRAIVREILQLMPDAGETCYWSNKKSWYQHPEVAHPQRNPSC